MGTVQQKESDSRYVELSNSDSIGFSNRAVGMFVSDYHNHTSHLCIFILTSIVSFCSLEIQRRCESIVKMVEKEIADIRKQEEEEEAQKAASTSAEGVATATATAVEAS